LFLGEKNNQIKEIKHMKNNTFFSIFVNRYKVFVVVLFEGPFAVAKGYFIYRFICRTT